MYDLTIKVALNGYVVRVGCQRVVFNDRELMLRALNDYLNDPEGITELYQRNSMNSKQLGMVPKSQGCACAEVPAPPIYANESED